jgi:lysophospholipase L1-like esterase
VRPSPLLAWLPVVAGLVAPPLAHAAEPFELKDGDRVVFLGATLVEQEQRHGYWETALTSRRPDRNITFRNLGWSGDNVWGDARAGFGSRADGFKALVEHVLALKPTVLIVGYGGNEAFEGEAGLAKFVEGYNTLLDALAPAKARVVLLAPLRQEDLGRPLPEPTAHNKDLRLYGDAIEELAKKRDCTFADLNPHLDDGPKAAPLTDDGLHLTAAGYWRTAVALERALGLPAPAWGIDVEALSNNSKAKGTKVEGVGSSQKATLTCRVADAALPPAPPPADGGARPDPTHRVVRVTNITDDKFTLEIDGKSVVTATGKEWGDKGKAIERGPDFDQAEELRKAIVAKNRLYFYRWRPANETYLFGFRKHEQGQNAVEIPKFDPLVEEKEKEIAKLRVPAVHTYELKPEAK